MIRPIYRVYEAVAAGILHHKFVNQAVDTEMFISIQILEVLTLVSGH